VARYTVSADGTIEWGGSEGPGYYEFRSQSLAFAASLSFGAALQITNDGSRFKLKFSPDKVDTMVVQAIALLDDLDKEINIYSMRVKVGLICA
jgi:nucleolar protein 58